MNNLSPFLRRELEILDKDAGCRKLAMKALKSYVKELDSKQIPLFLAQVSETKGTGSSGEFTISLYEVLARVHGTKIVSQIGNIMSTIIKTLSSSAGSFALHQACSKVVPAIARYGIEPTTPTDKKRHIIHSLCRPLSDCLLGSQESLSTGAALCLEALVDCDNWRYASNEMVNEVCQRVAGALEKHMQTNSHVALVMALAKQNSLIVEAYARLLTHIAVDILNAGVAEGSSQKRLSAIHMLSTMMKCLDQRSILSEVGLIIDEMEKFQTDQMADVSGAAFEALQTAKIIFIEKSPRIERHTSSLSGSNYVRRENGRRRDGWSSGYQSSLTVSPESQTIDSFSGFDTLVDSPASITQRPLLGYDCRRVKHQLWSKCENGGVDVSFKEGILSEAIHTSATRSNENVNFSSKRRDHSDGFMGFSQGGATHGKLRSTTPSPQRSGSHVNVDNVKIFMTPGKLIRSLQELNDMVSDKNEKQTRRHRSPSSRTLEWSPTFKHEQNCHCNGLYSEVNSDERYTASGEELQDSTESVSSSEDVDQQVLSEVKPGSITDHPQVISVAKRRWKLANLVCGIFMFLVAVCVVLLLLIEDEEAGYNLVPT